MKLKTIVLAGTAGLMLAASSAAFAQDNKITIGMASFFYGAPYFAGMDVAVHEEAKVFENVEIISTDAGGDIAKLASDIDDLLSKGVDAIIVSAGPTETLPASLNAIQEAGIPAVFVDRLWKNTNLTTPWNRISPPIPPAPYWPTPAIFASPAFPTGSVLPSNISSAGPSAAEPCIPAARARSPSPCMRPSPTPSSTATSASRRR